MGSARCLQATGTTFIHASFKNEKGVDTLPTISSGDFCCFFSQNLDEDLGFRPECHGEEWTHSKLKALATVESVESVLSLCPWLKQLTCSLP